jgi:Protein of unknown function (DUF4058)
MPIHDWTRVDAGTFHHFHLSWTCALCDILNTGGLPPDYYALMTQSGDDPFATDIEEEQYSRKADRIAIRHRLGRVIAVIEIVSPGNKSSRDALRAFVEKTTDLLRQGVHLLIIDLFPPTRRDPQGIHKAIWDELKDEPFELPADKPLTRAAYSAGFIKTAYVEPVAVGDLLPEMPLFLEPEAHVAAPLEATYQTAWNSCPAVLKGLLTP